MERSTSLRKQTLRRHAVAARSQPPLHKSPRRAPAAVGTRHDTLYNEVRRGQCDVERHDARAPFQRRRARRDARHLRLVEDRRRREDDVRVPPDGGAFLRNEVPLMDAPFALNVRCLLYTSPSPRDS